MTKNEYFDVSHLFIYLYILNDTIIVKCIGSYLASSGQSKQHRTEGQPRKPTTKNEFSLSLSKESSNISSILTVEKQLMEEAKPSNSSTEMQPSFYAHVVASPPVQSRRESNRGRGGSSSGSRSGDGYSNGNCNGNSNSKFRYHGDNYRNHRMLVQPVRPFPDSTSDAPNSNLSRTDNCNVTNLINEYFVTGSTLEMSQHESLFGDENM